ncbi:chymotrypsin-elastase inhibitor ixodidin-like [Anopheles marshallii]|uniref:chymotrypsin-elastase inhibitor ixodidin-like n=1 Tax=Anopheles marshallii TaxID=1521116 RepID=UPI00237A8A68|nr:chymotrypsin-elastase inhibitor ixodidin-like [Anopheles marshallii]
MRFETTLLAVILSLASMLAVILGQPATNDDPEPEPIVCSDPNEVYDDCGPICGDRTCANQRKNDVACMRSCMEGCFCKGGYVRNKSRKCIPSYMCSASG